MPAYNAEAIVVRVRDLGEADKVVHLLTRDRGKVAAVARGARRPRSRLAAATQLFTYCHVQCWTGRNLDTLSQAEIRDSFPAVREDLVRTAWAAYACELVDEMAQERQPVPEAFALLLAALRLLASPADPEVVGHAFTLQVLSALGFRPALDRCAGCGGPLGTGPHVRFSAAAGGALCPDCHGDGERVRLLARGTLEAMRHLLAADLATPPRLRLGPDMARELAATLDEYVEYRLERRPRSLAFLQSLRPPAR